MSDPGFQPPEISELQELLPAFGIENFIAAGGMGAVYQARQLSLDREVAIKILPSEFVADDELREQFATEAKAMAKLNDPNLIGIYDFGEVEGVPYLVMEFVDGQSLHDASHGVAIDPEVAASISMGIARGLAHAHDAGIIHRDIKPANILLTRDAQPKIGDFGLARPLESGSAEEVVFGTPGYTAPEVLSNPDAVGKQSDVYSVGVILYELLTGELPADPYVPASKKVRTHPRIDAIIKRAIHPDPAQRYPDAGALVADLEGIAPLLKKAALLTASTPAGKTAAKPNLATGRVATSAAMKGVPPPPATTRPQLSHSSGGEWHFLRNLVIIVVLAAAIFGVWKAIQFKQTTTSEKERAHRESIVENESQSSGTASPPVAPPTETPPPEQPPAPPASPMEQLAELQPSLAGGDRSSFPEGTHRRGDQAYFVVEEAMGWSAAAEFAEAHGGHLAVGADEFFVRWLAGKLPPGSNAWMGGGLVGPDRWAWVDGTGWTGTVPSRRLGNTIALSDLGTLRPMPASTELPFVIQWHMDGVNPGALDAQIARMKASADTPNPTWPVGSLHREGRHYLLVYRQLPQGQARSRAADWGGHLAVPSNDLETDFLLESVSTLLPAGQDCWLGGRFIARKWRWITGERWSDPRWSESARNAPRRGGVCIRSGITDGWTVAGKGQTPEAFLVEWSKDPENAEDEPIGEFDEAEATEALLPLRVIALRAFHQHRDQLRKDLANNRKDLGWDLTTWFNSLSGNERDHATPQLENIRTALESGEEHDPLPASLAEGELDEGLAARVNERLQKQQEIEAAYLDRLDSLRKAYLNQLTTKLAEFQEAGNREEASAFQDEIDALGQDGESLRAHFDISE